MSKVEQFTELRPSFLAFADGGLRRLAEAAYNKAAPEIRAKIEADSSKPDFVHADVLDAQDDSAMPFSHGHLPDDTGVIPEALSRRCPFRLKVTFKGDTLDEIMLELMALNPRFTLDKAHFIPADVGIDRAFKPLSEKPAPVGLITLADPDDPDPNARFKKLMADVPPMPTPPGYQDLKPETLLSRLDLTMTWKGGQGAKLQTDVFGRVFGAPDIVVPYGIAGLAIRLFSPELNRNFDGLLYSSGGFGVYLSSVDIDGKSINPIFIYGPPEKGDKAAENTADEKTTDAGKASHLYKLAVAEFGLSKDFAGFLFPGMEVHWLGEDRKGHDSGYEVGVGLTAIAIGGGTALGRKSGWFTSFHAKVKPLTENSYLTKLSEIELRANLADGAPTALSLIGTFRDLDAPFDWMNERRLRLSMIFQAYKDKTGKASNHLLIDSAIEGDGPKALATIKLKSDEERLVAAGLVLAPIVLSTGSINVGAKSVPPGPDERMYFTDVSSTETLTAAALSALLGWFFKNAIKIVEVRVVGARIQVQPALLNDAKNESGTDVALLFDYESDFTIDIAEAKLKSTRNLTTRIDGSGIAFGGAEVARWVQVPAGVRALSLADPGLWDIGALGKILKITEVSLRREPRRELRITLRLDGNFGIATAGDFVLSLDLEDGTGLRLEAHPSKLSFEIPKALKAEGILLIDKTGGKEDIAGSLDVTILPIGVRAYAGARVAQATGANGETAKALLAALKVQFPAMIPLASSGIGIKGFEGLYAAHFSRKEDESTPGVPKPLKWLEQVKGEVATSITHHKERWAVHYDHWAFGLGVELALQANSKLLNLNTIMLIERPGPVVTLFAKANVLQKPKDNKTVAKEGNLKTGILGLLQYNVATKEFLLAALADVQFKDYVRFRAPLELFATVDQLSKWHLYLGTPQNPVTGTLDIKKIVSIGVSGYFMAAGDRLTGLPGPVSELPGFALALGTAAYVQIGKGSLYLRVELLAYLALSIGEAIYAQGGVRVSGELRLFIVSIGVSSTSSFAYQRKPDGTSLLHIHLNICGHVKIFTLKISGCVTLKLGSPFSDQTEFPHLVEGLVIYSGTNVSLHGQGALSGIDAVSAIVNAVGGGSTPSEGIELDSALAINLGAAPEVDNSAPGFTRKLRSPRKAETLFNMGARSGSYLLTSVTLHQQDAAGDWTEFDYDNAPAVWWPNTQSPAGGQALPRQLALMTRDPLAVKNAMVSEEDLANWVDSILQDLCGAVIPAQYCVYLWSVSDLSDGSSGKWTLPALLRSSDLASAIGATSATPAEFDLLARPGAGSAMDPLPNLPLVIGGCFAAEDPTTGRALPILRMIKRLVQDVSGSQHTVTSRARVKAEISATRPLQLLLAVDQAAMDFTYALRCELKTAHGLTISIGLSSAAAQFESLDFTDAQARFHDGGENWIGRTAAFARLAQSPSFAGWYFYRLDLDLSAVSAGDHVTEFWLWFDTDGDGPDITLCIGALKYLPQAEIDRVAEDEANKSDTIAALKDYLQSTEDIPLLDPATPYRLKLDWQSRGDGALAKSQSYEFRTTEHPPASALPHLLSRHPEPGEKFHYWAEAPGFGLASPDLFRMLAKFPNARLRIRISDDAGNAVTNVAGDIDWHKGPLFDPADFLDPKPDPHGIHKDQIASLPSALQEALLGKIASGELDCLKPIKWPQGGVWIGFDVALRPLAGYSIDLSVVTLDGKPWPFPPNRTEATGDASLLSWRFATGLHGDLSDFAAELRNHPVRNRILESEPDFTLAVPETEAIRVMADKDLEDALVGAGGERPLPGNQPEITLYWIRRSASGGQEVQLVPLALALSCPDPILRRTEGCVITRQKVGERTIRLAERARLAFQKVDMATSKGIETVYLASSGFALVARLKADAEGECALAFGQTEVDRVPRALMPTVSLILDPLRLKPRPVSST